MRSHIRRHQAGFAAVALLVTVTLAGCGGHGKSGASDDAKAACDALVRTKAQLTNPSDPDWRRLQAAGDLGVAAATESKKKYGDLLAPFSQVYADALHTDDTKIYTDARATLSACADHNLPH